MKYIKILSFLMLICLLIFIFLKNKEEITQPKSITEITHNEVYIENPVDVASILNEFFKVDFPITNLVANISSDNIIVSGNLKKELLKTYLESNNLLDFKTKTALLLLKDTVFVKIEIKSITTEKDFSLSLQNIQIENFSLDVNFLIYTLNF